MLIPWTVRDFTPCIICFIILSFYPRLTFRWNRREDGIHKLASLHLLLSASSESLVYKPLEVNPARAMSFPTLLRTTGIVVPVSHGALSRGKKNWVEEEKTVFGKNYERLKEVHKIPTS